MADTWLGPARRGKEGKADCTPPRAAHKDLPEAAALAPPRPVTPRREGAGAFALTPVPGGCYKETSCRAAPPCRCARPTRSGARKEGSMRGTRALVLALAAGLAAAGPEPATNPNERAVKPAPNVQDPDDITSPDSKVWV